MFDNVINQINKSTKDIVDAVDVIDKTINTQETSPPETVTPAQKTAETETVTPAQKSAETETVASAQKSAETETSAAAKKNPPLQKSASAVNEQTVFVQGRGDFREISLLTWKGLPRLGSPAVSVNELEKTIKSNKPLAEQQYKAVEHHNYSVCLLNMLDNMRVHEDCYKDLNTYEAKVKQCSGTVIGHSAQVSPWRDKLRVLAYLLNPDAYESSYRIGKSLFPAAIHKNFVESGGSGNNYNEFEVRDWYAGLMAKYDSAFENVWRNSHLPEKAWYVFRVSLGNYDFEKKQYSFLFTPQHINLRSDLNSRYAANIKIDGFNSRLLPAPTPAFQPVHNFEKNIAPGTHNMRMAVPMEPQQARKIAESDNNNRTFYAVVKLQFLPRNQVDQWGPTSKNVEFTLNWHYAENKLQLFQDSHLTRKIAELPIFPEKSNASVTENAQTSADRISKDYRIFDWFTLSMMRFKLGSLNDRNLQELFYAISGCERRSWSEYQNRLNNFQKPNLSAKQKEYLQDATKLAHICWQDMNQKQKKDFYRYIEKTTAWPASFPEVNWGMNIATIFPKGHFSLAPGMADVPGTREEKAVIAGFVKDLASDYQTKSLLAVYDLREIRYDNQNQRLVLGDKARWPFNPAPTPSFDDQTKAQYNDKTIRLISARARDRAIYTLQTSAESYTKSDPDPNYRRSNAGCYRNDKTQSLNCSLTHGNLNIHSSWSYYFALDRELPFPDLKLTPEHGNRLVHSQKRNGPGWRLMVEFDNAEMAVSPFTCYDRNSKTTEPYEGITVFASVKRARILAPNDEVVWSATGDQLKAPAL